MLKAELHTHIDIDPLDRGSVGHSVYDLIDCAKIKGFDVIGITCHNYLFDDKDAISYAKKQGILILPGIEKNIDGKHTLVYNTSKEINQVYTLKKLKEFKERNKEILIIAPHPFYFLVECHGKNIIKYPDLFDAWEYSYFYTKWFNRNKKLKRLSKKYKKPLVGSSDVHDLRFLGQTYTLIDSKLEKKEIIKSIKQGRVQVVTKPLSSKVFLSLALQFLHFIKKEEI